jgi:hypothetical protein
VVVAVEHQHDRALVDRIAGLRRTAGLRAWPLTRRVEADLIARVAEETDPAAFEEAFSGGSDITRRQAIALVRSDRPLG